MTVPEWLQDHWPGLISSFTAGGGGILFGKKLKDRQQDKKIKDLETRVSQNETDIRMTNQKLDNNSTADRELKEYIDKRLDRIENKQDAFMDKLFAVVTKKGTE